MASVSVDNIFLSSFLVVSSPCSITKLVAFITATMDATRAFCVFCAILNRLCGLVLEFDPDQQIKGFTRGVRNPMTFPGRGYFSTLN